MIGAGDRFQMQKTGLDVHRVAIPQGKIAKIKDGLRSLGDNPTSVQVSKFLHDQGIIDRMPRMPDPGFTNGVLKLLRTSDDRTPITFYYLCSVQGAPSKLLQDTGRLDQALASSVPASGDRITSTHLDLHAVLMEVTDAVSMRAGLRVSSQRTPEGFSNLANRLDAVKYLIERGFLNEGSGRDVDQAVLSGLKAALSTEPDGCGVNPTVIPKKCDEGESCAGMQIGVMVLYRADNMGRPVQVFQGCEIGPSLQEAAGVMPHHSVRMIVSERR